MLAPPITMLVIVIAVVLRLVIVVVSGALDVPTAVEVNVRLGGANLMAVPSPLSAEVCVPAPSTTLRVADCRPSALGLNSTEMVQFAPAAKVEPQVLALIGNSAEDAPVTEMLEIVSVVVPVLVRVATLGWLVEPIAIMPQPKLEGVRLRLAAVIGP